jgi:hypothetical protein
MRFAIGVVAVAAAVAGCGPIGDGEALIGPDRSFGAAIGIAEAQWDDVNRIAVAEGATRFADLPLSGSGTYRGAITGWASGGIPLDYVADLTLDVDFRDLRVSGEVANMVTDRTDGFRHPDGRIGLYGEIVRDDRGEARIVIDGAGTLRGPGMETDVRIDGAGAFAGADGRALHGRHATDFEWLRGYPAGALSRSDGVFSAVAE